MSSGQYAARGPLWAEIKRDREHTIPLPLAFLIAALLELGIFAAVFFVDWSDEYGIQEPPPMTVELVKPEPPKEEPKPEPIKPPEPPPPEPIKKPEPTKPILKVEPPKVEIKPEPKPEPKIVIPEPEPIPQPKVEPPPPQPLPEPKPEPKVELPPSPEPVKEEPKIELKEQTAPPKQVRNAKPLRKVAAAYPRSALKNGTTGRVKARLTVGEGGDVIDVEIMESSPPGVFDDAVTKAVKQYRFEADGSKYLVDQEVLFKLED